MEYLNLNPGTGVKKPKAGMLLIAEPLLDDPNFSRTVVLLCEHGSEGSIGFVLNQATEHTLQDLLPELYVAHLGIYSGGPVQANTLHMLHRIRDIDGGLEVAKGIFWGGSYESLKDMIMRDNYDASDIRLFMGYSGWGPGQLEKEMKEGTWLVADAPESLLFETDLDDIWKRSIDLLGKRYSFLANVPIDPQLN